MLRNIIEFDFVQSYFFSILRIDQFFNIKPISDQYQNQYQTNTGINTRSKSYQNQINTRSISSQCQCQSPQGVHSQITASSQRVHSVFTACSQRVHSAKQPPQRVAKRPPQRVKNAKQFPQCTSRSRSKNIRAVPNQYPINTRSISDRYHGQ